MTLPLEPALDRQEPETARETALTVVVPVYNEVRSVEELHGAICAELGDDVEIIFVDDGSRDGSREILTRLAASRPKTRVLGFRRNYGKSYALAAGFRRARGRWIATLDGDLQDDPREIPRLLEELHSGWDVVGGRRRERRDSVTKMLASWFFNALVRLLGRVDFRDINSGLKVFRREVVEEIHLTSGYHRFLLLLAHWKGFRVREIEVEHRARRHGVSRYGASRILRAVMDLAVLMFLERFEGRPGRYFAGLGVLMGCVGGGILTYLAYLRTATGSIQSKFPLLSLGLLLVVLGVELVSLGFVSELLAYHFRSRHPLEPVVWEAREDSPSGSPSAVGSEDTRR